MTEEAVGDLVDEWGASLYAYALRHCGSRERAEEIVQDTLVKAWQHPDLLAQPREAQRAWLYTVVRHAATDAWRRDAARPHVVGSPSGNVAAPEDLDRAIETWVLRDAVARLSDEHRRVLHHAFYLGHSVAQTATALRVAPGTVKSRTYYALRALRVILEEMGYVQ
ncbi:MAG: sigma-70 family RNA polymerase sigma factor [Acidimicrobiales bacterium]